MTERTHCANCGGEVDVDKPHQVGECRMTAETLNLWSFLLARIAEDETLDMGLPHRQSCSQSGGWPDQPESAVACDCGVTARVLSECAAKRAIVERHQPAADGTHYGSLTGFACGTCTDFHADMECEGEQWPCLTVRALASIYSDHPDYREEWLP